MSFCFLYNVVSENYSVQNSPWGEGGLLPAQGLFVKFYTNIKHHKLMLINSTYHFIGFMALCNLQYRNRLCSEL